MFADPAFQSFTVVYAMYCDGGSWTGALDTPPVQVNLGARNQTVYYRGAGLLHGLLQQLIQTEGIRLAKEVIYSGCSAGGLTTYIHVDAVAKIIRQHAQPGVKVVALADAMFSLQHRDFSGSSGKMTAMMTWGWDAWRAEAAVNQACVSSMNHQYGDGSGWRCMFGANVAPFITTPTFVLNSKYDIWQMKSIIGVQCPISEHVIQCNASVTEFWVDYGREMVAALDALPARHGAFVHNCAAHCQTGAMYDEGTFWSQSTIGTQHMGATFVKWYQAIVAGTGGPSVRAIERCDVAPCGADVCSASGGGVLARPG